jgi:hypothetical protein
MKFLFDGDFRRAFSGITTIGVNYQAAWTVIWAEARRKINFKSSIIKELFYMRKNEELYQMITE